MTEYYGEFLTNSHGFTIYADSDILAIKKAKELCGTNLLCLYRFKNKDATPIDIDYHDFEFIWQFNLPGPVN